MRVVLLSRGFPPDAIGGTEIYTQMLAVGLRNRGHEVKVVCVGRWTEGVGFFTGSSTDTHGGVEAVRLHLDWRRAPDPNRCLYSNPAIAEFVSGFVKRIRPDVVHVLSCDRLSASVIRSVKKAAVPVVLSLTDFWFLCPRSTLVRWDGQLCDGNTTAWDCLRCSLGSARAYTLLANVLPQRALEATLTAISRRASLTRYRGLRGLALNMAERKEYVYDALRLADYLTIATPFGARLFRTLFPDLRFHVTPYGHDLNWIKSDSAKTPSNELRIGYIAALCEAKGPHILLEAFRRLPASTGVRLSIYGHLPTDAFGQKLLELASGDSRIQFCGCYAHERSPEIYSNLDVLVVPSLWYDFPLVAHEALATETVVVATDLPGLNEIVTNEVNGLLFERGDAGALAEQLRRLARSPELVAKLRAGRGQVRRIEDAVAEFERVYSDAAATRRATAAHAAAPEVPDDER